MTPNSRRPDALSPESGGVREDAGAGARARDQGEAVGVGVGVGVGEGMTGAKTPGKKATASG